MTLARALAAAWRRALDRMDARVCELGNRLGGEE